MADLTSVPEEITPCDIGELLSAYLDGELTAGELDRVVEHLGTCLDCILEFRQLKEVRASIRTLPMFEMPEYLLPDGHLGPALSAYLDGELPTIEFDNVFVHIEGCADCRAELHELDAARTAIRSLPGLEPPEFIEFHRAGRAERETKPHRTWRVAALVASAAAAVALTVGVTTSSGEPQPAVDLDSFADRHIARASVEPGFVVLPAVSGGDAP